MFRPDGAFRIDDVPPGDYTIKINLFTGFFSNWRRARRSSFITQRLYRIDF